MADYKTIDIECPYLLKEWDYDKNGTLSPHNVRKFSGKRVWWKCKKGHSWCAPVRRRSAGSGCPYCSGNLVLFGYNDLLTTHPEIAVEWDYEKNGTLIPQNITAGSNKLIWWKCLRGHSWKTTVASRTAGSGCPYCAGKIPVKGNTDLLTLYPGVAAEWDYQKNNGLTPEDVKAHSNLVVWWKCSKGHSWQTEVHVRTSGHDCPYCAGLKAVVGENDLKSIRPDLVKEWDYKKNKSILPENVKCSSNISVWWKCSQGHSWKTAISHRSEGQNCPYCSGKRVLSGYNDIETTHPQLVSEWDCEKNSITPKKVSAGSNKKIWWKCKLGHSWQAAVVERTKGNGCPYCSGRRVLKGFNDIKTTHPVVAKEWDYDKNNQLLPSQISAGSNKIVWWKCECGHSWKATVYSRTGSNASGCPYCAGHAVLKYFNDFKTLNPEIAREWDYKKNYPLRPEDVSKTSNKKVWWICDEGHSYSATMSNRNYGKNCPYCAGKYPILGVTDLATTHPELIEEWDFEKNKEQRPEHYTCGSNAKVWWKCKFGHSWRSTICDRNAGNGCPYCSGRMPMRTRLV